MKHAPFTYDEIEAAISAAIAERDATIAKLKQLDSEAATHVESQIVMFDRFTGEPPYVGWKGLGLALKEELEAKDATIAELRAALNEAAWAIQYGKHLHPKTLAGKWSAIAEGKKP